MRQRTLSSKTLFYLLLAGFLISLIPIFLLGRYITPLADDFSYGARAYHARMAGGSIFAMIRAAAEQAASSYRSWQGTYSAIFVMALQPAVFGEQYYVLTPFVMLAGMIAGTWCLLCTVCGELRLPKYTAGILTLSVCLVGVQLAPSARESFFWFNGSVYYTFWHGLFLMALALAVKTVQRSSWQREIGLCLLAVVLGGGNYVTALTAAIVGAAGIALLVLRRNQGWRALILPLAVFFAAFALSVFAPGNNGRQSSNGHVPSAMQAVLSSLQWGMKDSLRWLTRLPVLGLILFLVLYLRRAIPEEGTFRFPMPGLVSLCSYLLLSAMYCPPFYGLDGVPERAMNIIFYSFLLMLALNLIWWIGWLKRRRRDGETSSTPGAAGGGTAGAGKGVRLPVWRTAACLFLWLLCFAAHTRTGVLNSVLALSDLRSGEAQGYRQVYEERLQLLHDPEVREVVFEPCPYFPYLTGWEFPSDPGNWVNRSVAEYYGKDSVRTAGSTQNS